MKHQRGVTLVELMVALVIGLVVTLAVTSIVVTGESRKRSTTGVNDANQTGSYATYVIDRAVRSAGSGFTQAWNLGVFGCKLAANRGASRILPRTTAFPAPFAGVPVALPMAPVLIHRPVAPQTGSDVLIVMSGTGASGDTPRPILSTGSSETELRLSNTIGLAGGDLALVSRSGTADCLIEQIDPALSTAVGNETLPLSGRYYTSAGADTSLTTLVAGGGAYLSALGKPQASSPMFQMLGVNNVNSAHTLVSYDLLQTAGTAGDDAATLEQKAQQALADGVVEMRVLYGIDTDNNGTFNAWASPTGDFAAAALMDKGNLIKQVVALRVAIVVRSANYEKTVVAPDALTLFSGVKDKDEASLEMTVPISTEDQHFRHRVIDTIIPLRNTLLLPTS